MTVSAALLNYDRFWAGFEILNASTWDPSEFRSTRLAGTIQCDRDGLLYTSIPQNGNWVAQVDGRTVQTRKVGGCMLALDLTAGEHTVVLTYRNGAFSLGWKVSLVCAVGFLLLLRFVYRPDRQRPGASRHGKYQR